MSGGGSTAGAADPLVCLARDLERFALILESGPTGWQLVPMIHAAVAQMVLPTRDDMVRLQGALYVLLYGFTPTDVRKAYVVAECRRIVSEIRESVNAAAESGQ